MKYKKIRINLNLKRKSGIMLNISSLPSKYGIGDLGKGAYKFIDFLFASSQSYWQMFAYSPIDFTRSPPYSIFSAFAGNVYYIDLEALDKFIDSDLNLLKENETRYSDLKKISFKDKFLKEAALNFINRASVDEVRSFEKFKKKSSYWLLDFASFVAFKEYFLKDSRDAFNVIFDRGILKRNEKDLFKLRNILSKEIKVQEVLQYFFFSQFQALKRYANDKGIELVMNVPLFIAYDSADVWAHQKYFKLRFDASKDKVAGISPDYFLEQEQAWDSPAYSWNVLKKVNYEWWVKRIEILRKYVDVIKIDHFRGFVSTWEVSVGEAYAFNGLWVKSPGRDFFNFILNEIKDLKIWVEDFENDLEDASRLRDFFNFSGMRIMKLAFDFDSDNQNLPHNYTKNCIVYTGIGDNGTIREFVNSLDDLHKKYIFDYLNTNEDFVVWGMIRSAMSSVSDNVIIPMQDYISLGDKFSVNIPKNTLNNWIFRLLESDLDATLSKNISFITRLYGRA